MDITLDVSRIEPEDPTHILNKLAEAVSLEIYGSYIIIILL